jgi:nitrogen fixation protein FixH
MTKTMTLKGWHVLALLLAFFGAVLAVNVVFITKALHSYPGEYEPKSYAQGLKYNAILRDRDAQNALGWRAEAGLSPGANGAAAISIRLFDRAGAPIKGAHIEGVLRRPVDAHLDHALSFTEVSDGAYAAPAPPLAEGQWTLHARARANGAHFDLQKTVIWRTQAP